ncbi:MAG: NAD-dependent epimerase/dehydratase family protein, partial [Anaerolineae bacterium]|nr:NAD-dependent epimerase/dehydratase family protein [Anaerolineae bacterium]
MRILITGGSGLIGSTLTESLAADGHEVIIVSRNPQGIKNISKGVTAVGWEKESLAANLENADAVINLAGASIAGETPLNMRWTAKRKKQILESRVESGNKLAEALKVVKNKPNVFIQSS